MSANRLHRFAAAFRIYLFQYAMKMIPHRKRRKIQLRRDFLIRKPLGHQRHQLLLPQRQIRLGQRVLHRRVHRELRNELE